jgi:LuxR family transcriptional regulator, maltose regulon positive regulatory protein
MGAVQAPFDALLREWPLPLHLVLTLRRDPPWQLAPWRARGLVTEVRGSDLRFARAEIEAYLALRWPGPLAEGVLDRLDDAAEGWIAALQLATLSLHSADLANDELVAWLGG